MCFCLAEVEKEFRMQGQRTICNQGYMTTCKAEQALRSLKILTATENHVNDTLPRFPSKRPLALSANERN